MKKKLAYHIHKKHIKIIIFILFGLIAAISIVNVLNIYKYDFELMGKKILFKVQNHPNSFSFHKIKGTIPPEYFIEKQNDSCLTIIKLRNLNDSNASDNFERKNRRFVTLGMEIRKNIMDTGADAKAKYYKTLDELVRIGALSRLHKDTLTIEDMKFEGDHNEYYNFENGISIYYWGITKTELNELLLQRQ